MTRGIANPHEEENLERHRRSVDAWLRQNGFDTTEALAVASEDVRVLARRAGHSLPPRSNVDAERRREREQRGESIGELHRRQSLVASHRQGYHRHVAREACPLCQHEAESG